MRYLLLVTLFIFSAVIPATAQNNESKKLLIRTDDMGFTHAANMAAKDLMEAGIPFSVSVMFACAWYQEAVEILKEHPEVSVGVHLTLNAEWKRYRWGPVLGKEAVPSLVDSCGFFLPSREKFYLNEPTLEDIEKELRAQIDRAVNSGIRIDYVDYHMGTAVGIPEHRAIVEKLADEYGLAISRYFGEEDSDNMYSEPPDQKQAKLIDILDSLDAGKTYLLVTHVIHDTPEAQALIDLNSFGLENMSKHRRAELDALLSDEFQKALIRNKIELITYRELIEQQGLENMKSPVDTGY